MRRFARGARTLRSLSRRAVSPGPRTNPPSSSLAKGGRWGVGLSRGATIVTLLSGISLQAAPKATAPPHPPAEELRLNTFQFREWLRKQGLTEVLELHLKDFPPSDPTAAALTEREFKLGEFRNAQRSTPERQAAIRDAGDILAKLIADFPEDPRALQWRYTLAHSLIYDQGEPSATAILYFGGGPDDRRTLGDSAQRSLEVTRALSDRIARENARIDRLSSAEFEEVERHGLIEQLDRLGPSADYLLLWVLFYDALARDDGDPRRMASLREVNEAFIRRPELLQTPQEKSGVQAPALLLVGMTARALGHADLAKDYLERASTTWERIPAGEGKDRLRWMFSLAAIERIRAERDAGRFDRALIEVDRLRTAPPVSSDDGFGLRLAAALVEKSIHLAQAALSEKMGESSDAAKCKEKAWGTLQRLVTEFPDRRESVVATVLASLGLDADASKLDPFEQSVLMTGLSWQAQRDPSTATNWYRKAVEVGEGLLRDLGDAQDSLVAETLYQLGLAHLRLAEPLAAARCFGDAAQRDPQSRVALPAVTLAASTAAELCQNAGTPNHDEGCVVYAEALDLLLGLYTDSEAGKYWRFFRGQLRDERGNFETAAADYTLVDPAHEHFLDSRFLRVRALAKALETRAKLDSTDKAALEGRSDSMLAALEQFASLPGAAGTKGKSLLADSRLICAEAILFAGVERPAKPLELVTGLESAACARVWRVRILAHERMGQSDSAGEGVAALAVCDAVSAGPVLQSLHDAMVERFDKAAKISDSQTASRRARLALLLAQRVDDWSKAHDPASIGKDARSVRAQLAEAYLRADQPEAARKLFDELAGGAGTEGSDIMATLGRAEAQFQQGQFAEALPAFAKLATTLPSESPKRWKALLRDLQCRTRLGHPAQGVLKVLSQQKFLYPEMGGQEFAEHFETLRLENEKRRETPSP